MIGVDDMSKNLTNVDLGFRNLLASIAVKALTVSIPVVYLNGLVFNISSLFCHRLEPQIVDIKSWDSYLAKLWSKKPKGENSHK